MIWIYHWGFIWTAHFYFPWWWRSVGKMDIKWWDLWPRSKGSAIQEQYRLCIGPTDLRFGPMVHILLTAMFSGRFKTCTKMKCGWTQIVLNKYVMDKYEYQWLPSSLVCICLALVRKLMIVTTWEAVGYNTLPWYKLYMNRVYLLFQNIDYYTLPVYKQQ